MTVTEYSSASLKDQLGLSTEDEATAAAVDGSTSSPGGRPFVDATIDPSNLSNCSCTSIVQLRSYSTFRRSAKVRRFKSD